MERPKICDYNKIKTFDWEYVFKLWRYIEYLERQILISKLRIDSNSKITFCECMDRCSSKRNEYYCDAKRQCKHKV